MQDEFSHTVLHKEKFNVMKQQMPRPVSAGMAEIIEDLVQFHLLVAVLVA